MKGLKKVKAILPIRILYTTNKIEPVSFTSGCVIPEWLVTKCVPFTTTEG